MATEEKKKPVKGILKSSSSFDHEKHKEYAHFFFLFPFNSVKECVIVLYDVFLIRYWEVNVNVS